MQCTMGFLGQESLAQGVAGAPCDLRQACDELAQACREVTIQCTASRIAKKACEVMMQKCGRVDSVLQELLSRTSDSEKLAHTKHTNNLATLLHQTKLTNAEKDTVEKKDMVEQRRFSIPEKKQAQALKGDSNPLDAPRKPGIKPPPTFTARCRALHGGMHAIVQVDLECDYEWPEFCRELEKEGISHDRWSQPVHIQLAEALRMEGFSKHDWETSLLDKNGKVTYSPQIDIDKASWLTYSPQIDIDKASWLQMSSNLNEAQMKLDTRMRKYFWETTQILLGKA